MSSPSVLMVAEKPSICNAIASALCGGRMESRKGNPPVHEFNGNFLGRNAFIRVTAVNGHVFSTDFPAQYQNWDAVDPVELFSAPIVSVAEKGGIVKHLEREGKGMDYLVLWLDCDREGENICFEVIRCVEKSMRKGGNGQKIYRAKFSAVTPKDIQKALQSLVSPNENESMAVEARQEMDLKVGVAFSRFQTRYFQGKYGDLDSAVISYGPCQTPTLAFCVDRHDEIQTFTPEPFWTLDITVQIESQNIAVEWSRGRLFDQEITKMFLKMVNESDSLLCVTVKQSEGTKPRPTPLNTVELLKIASKSLGIGPQSAMRAAEHLYLSGYLSYPRTESTSYPDSFDVKDALQVQTRNPHVGAYAQELLGQGYTRPRKGHDAGDHPPITPVGMPSDLSSLGSEERSIFDLVCRYFLATVSPDASYISTTLTFSSACACGEHFTASGRRELSKGFERIYGTSSRDVEIPAAVEGRRYKISTSRIREGQTSAPSYLTESELLGLMEKHHIGTDASMATHINNISVRNYVTIGSGRTLVPTSLGVVLIHGFLRIDPALVKPEVRAAIEKFCDMIAQGKAAKDQVVQHSLLNFEKKFRYFTSHISAMDNLFEVSFSPLAATGAYMCKCGKCSRYMRFIPLKPQRLYCPTCEETYNLPQNGTIKLYKELRCPLDNFELVLYSLGNSATAQGKSYALCPNCYNHPPSFDIEDGGEEDAEDEEESAAASPDSTVGPSVDKKVTQAQMFKGMGCNSCRHPTCKHSSVRNGMCRCPSFLHPDAVSGPHCPGMLVLDVNSKPNW
eukprot:CAMPEP_0182435572 /NCGR_PEP_ID=MMETSP1167-20130531/76539_1 /TAXON_ID=2988 /ORGANISM="Mallomonas Sp, Strain CCMP3275" /LENGTH=790 /DNA_ID=CAMNT_0024626779 /DNA_START=237 /DNA_END=2606 /DNA_ORIENTATION=+